ncbi:MAG: hypothetical protein L6Q37_03020 [Bdellovibrionaceae bacterium]|nr:hypothetical protein [Pseudobdellovibrionaceae bacterium]
MNFLETLIDKMLMRLRQWQFFFLVSAIFVHQVQGTERMFPGELEHVKNFGEGRFNSRQIEIPAILTSPITVNTSNGQVLLPDGTRFDLYSNMDFMLKPSVPEQTEDPFLQTILERFKMMTFFQLMENRSQTNEDSASLPREERRSYKEKIKIKSSIDKKLKDQEMEIEIKAEDLKKIKVDGELDLPVTLESDYDGSETWNPNQNYSEGSTEGIFNGNCKVCQKNPQFKMGEILFHTKAQQINDYFERLLSPWDLEVKSRINQSIKYAKEHRKSQSIGYCYRYVKEALLQSGLTKKRLEGVYPKNSDEVLKKEGYKNLLDPKQLEKTRLQNVNFSKLIDHPNLAPKGAILVYGPTDKNKIVKYCDRDKANRVIPSTCKWGQDAGHIEIKTEDSGKGGFVSDYFHQRARTGDSMRNKDRVLVGIYYKL